MIYDLKFPRTANPGPVYQATGRACAHQAGMWVLYCVLWGLKAHNPVTALRTKKPLKVRALYPYTLNPYIVYEP